jgi:hypothetical protein
MARIGLEELFAMAALALPAGLMPRTVPRHAPHCNPPALQTSTRFTRGKIHRLKKNFFG